MRVIASVKPSSAALSWPQSADHMFVTAVLTQQLPSVPSHDTLWKKEKGNRFLVCIMHAAIAKSAHLEEFKINSGMVTISGDVFPLYLV